MTDGRSGWNPPAWRGYSEREELDIAAELKLPYQYVELIQEILCSISWCEDGTSPRGCWVDHPHDADALIAKFGDYFRRQWVDDEAAYSPVSFFLESSSA